MRRIAVLQGQVCSAVLQGQVCSAGGQGFVSGQTQTPCLVREGAGRFAGRTIIITGAGGNFGRAGTLYFAREGANVVAMDYNAEELAVTSRIVEQVCGAGGARGQCHAIVVDVTSEDEVARAVAEAAAKFGRIELLWNNAGTMGDIVPTLQYSAREFRRVLEVNVVGMFIVLRAVAAVMAASGGGAICNTASVAGMRGTPAMPACEWLPPDAAPAPAPSSACDAATPGAHALRARPRQPPLPATCARRRHFQECSTGVNGVGRKRPCAAWHPRECRKPGADR